MSEGRIDQLLARHHAKLISSLDDMVACFYLGLEQDKNSNKILSVLSSEERINLHRA